MFTWIFVIALLFAALDAFNIGANDVANSFATSVSSRSLTLSQACVLAAFCEFLGAVLLGARVAGTIKNGIISLSTFQGNPGVQMLGFTCALVTSASWLMLATYKSWPVSTTYSIVSALAGVGVALGGADSVQWGWNHGKGLASIWAGMLIAPAIAGGFASIVYLITKYTVLVRANPLRAGLYFAPFFFFTVTAVLTMAIVWKGAPSLNLDEMSDTTTALAIVLTALVVSVLSILFWLPFVYCRVFKKDYTLRWYHFFLGPLLWKRPAPEPITEEEYKKHVVDYRIYGRDKPEPTVEVSADAEKAAPRQESSSDDKVSEEGSDEIKPKATAPASPLAQVPLAEVEKDPHQIEGPWILPKNLWIIIRYKIPRMLTHGSGVDIHKMQLGGKDAEHMASVMQASTQYPSEVEHLFSFLQVLTACTNSFAHGSNDVANAVGPFAAIYYVWSEEVVTPKNTPTPVWILAFGGAMIVLGLATYGYNIMAVMGNRLTLMSPSRGYSMELGSSITVVLASQFAIPVSTTMAITGATAGVGLVSGGHNAINWRAIGWIVLGWVLTIPVVGTGAGVLTAMFINAPHF